MYVARALRLQSERMPAQDRCNPLPSVAFRNEENDHGNAPEDRAHPSPSQSLRQPRKSVSAQELNSRGVRFASNQSFRFVPVEIFEAIDCLAEFGQHAVLHTSALQSHGIRNAMKGHHRILGHKEAADTSPRAPIRLSSGTGIGDRQPGLASPMKFSIAISAIASVFALRALSKSAKTLFPVCSMPVQKLQQDRAVFESAINSLPKKRNDGVGCIAQQQALFLRRATEST